MLLTYMRPLRRTSAWSALGVGRVRGGEEGEGRGRGRERRGRGGEGKGKGEGKGTV